MVTAANQMIFRFLDTVGDGSGTKNANGDYSSTPEEFFFVADADCEIHRLIIHINDTAGMDADAYGNLAGALSTGYSVKVNDGAVDLLDLCDGIPITNNGGIGRYCYDVEVKTWSAGTEFLQSRWTFAKAGKPLHLNAGDRISITFNDNLSGLLEHYFGIQGYYL